MRSGQNDSVSEIAGGSSVFSSLKHGSGGAADRLGSKSILCVSAVHGHAVKIGGESTGIVGHARGIIPLLVGKEKNYIIIHVITLRYYDAVITYNHGKEGHSAVSIPCA